MMNKIIDVLIFLSILFIEISLLATNYWWIANIHLLVIISLVKLVKGNELGAILYLAFGSVIVDLLMFRQVGQVSLFFFLSILITRIISNNIKALGVTGSKTSSVFTFLIFLLINNFYLYISQIVTLTQISIVSISGMMIFIGFLFLVTKNKTNHGYKF